jgi:hypothetical protein
LYSFAGDTAHSGTLSTQNNLDTAAPVEPKTIADSLRQDAYNTLPAVAPDRQKRLGDLLLGVDSLHQDAYNIKTLPAPAPDRHKRTLNPSQDVNSLQPEPYPTAEQLPPVAPDRHRNQGDSSQYKEVRPIIIEYNSIYINGARPQGSPQLESQAERHGQAGTIQAPYARRYEQEIDRQNGYRNDPGYPDVSPYQTAPVYPGYSDTPPYPTTPVYPGYPGDQLYPNSSAYPYHSNFQHYPIRRYYPAYTFPPVRNNEPSPAPLPSSYNHGKFDQLLGVLKEMGPLAFDITALTTSRRGFYHYPGSYLPPYNCYSWNNNFANSFGISPYALPAIRY